MESSREDYWSELPFPPSGDLHIVNFLLTFMFNQVSFLLWELILVVWYNHFLPGIKYIKAGILNLVSMNWKKMWWTFLWILTVCAKGSIIHRWISGLPHPLQETLKSSVKFSKVSMIQKWFEEVSSLIHSLIIRYYTPNYCWIRQVKKKIYIFSVCWQSIYLLCPATHFEKKSM